MNKDKKDKIVSRKLIEKGVLTEKQAEEVMKLPLPEEET